MNLKTQINLIGKWLERNITEYLHWVLSFAPILASILGTFINSINHKAEVVLVTSAIGVNLLLLWLRSRWEKNKELSLFRTFITGNVGPPVKPAGELLFNTEIAIVEEGDRKYFVDQLNEKFQTKPKTGARRENELDERLRFRTVRCLSLNGEGDDEELITKTAELKRNLSNDLSRSEAVIVVRTEELDGKDWVYESVHDWASLNSEAPVLFVRPHSRTTYSKNTIADRFWWIRDNAKSLPWSLLKRARDRASAWRSQATYNRALVSNIFFISAMLIWLAANWISTDRQRHAVTMNGISEAAEMRQAYQTDVMKQVDEGLHVSYWFWNSSEGKPYAFVTTEKGEKINSFELNEKSLTGCGFLSPNRILEWREGDSTKVYHWNDGEDKQHNCTMDPRVEPIRAIVCSAYQPSGDPAREATVGICVFTESVNVNIFGEDKNRYRDFLRTRTEDFQLKFGQRIKDSQVVPWAKQPKSVEH